ncbi:MAG: class I SAM-dependent methyltransferase [Candidatus Methylomirabilales bacterium]
MPPGTIIRTCRGCGLSVRTPLPLARDAAAAYDAEYYREYQMVGRKAPPTLMAALPLLEPAVGPGRLLEIGCGLGSFLAQARERGWNVQGVEVSPWAATQAKQASSVPVLISRAEALPFHTGTFDAVVSHHVFEHLPDPFQALRESRRVCRTGGRLLLVLPNELQHLFLRSALQARHGLRAGDGLVANLRRWLAYQTAKPPRDSSHIFFFHPRVLRQAAEQTGWHPLRLTTFRTQRDTVSGYALGGLLKTSLYALEVWMRRGPEMALLAEAREAVS